MTYWENWTRKRRDIPKFPKFIGTKNVGVCIIGGGIFGVSAALELQSKGYQCTLLEARTIGSGTTGNSQGILTPTYETVISKIKKSFNTDVTKTFSKLGLQGIQNIKKNIEKYEIDCDYEEVDFYTYAENTDELEMLKKERELGVTAGLTTLLETNMEGNKAPMPCAGLLKISNTAQFNPYAYTIGMADAFIKLGGEIYEKSRVVDVKGLTGPHTICLENGATLDAKIVILATKLPILDRSGHFSLIKCWASYQVVLPVQDPSSVPKCTYSAADSTKLEGKAIRWADKGKAVTIVGFAHPLGEMDKVKDFNPFDELIKFGKKYLGVAEDAEVLGKYFDFDYQSPDILPYIGQLHHGTSSIFTATCFNLWGLSIGSAAPEYIVSLLDKKDSDFKIFDATRWDPMRVTKTAIETQGKVLKHFVGERVKNVFQSTMDVKDLKPGEAGVCKYEGKVCGCFKDQNGNLSVVDMKCQHLGCKTTLNKYTLTYDCACHGSRYNMKGEVICGPTVKPLTLLKCDIQGEIPNIEKVSESTTQEKQTGQVL